MGKRKNQPPAEEGKVGGLSQIRPTFWVIPAGWRQGLFVQRGVLGEEEEFSPRRKKVKWADQAESALPKIGNR